MSESSYNSYFQAEKQAIQLGDHNTQIIQTINNIDYGRDSEEEPLGNFDEHSPYKGLASFTSYDSGQFYGRKKFVNDLVKDLEKEGFILLLGASGSGKSSLVQAGLIPQLSSIHQNLVKLDFVPGEDPFDSFFDELIRNLPKQSKKYKKSDIENVISKISASSDSAEVLTNIIKDLRKDESELWIIFIDQFEEFFTRTPEQKQKKFIQSLNKLISYQRELQNKSLKIILAMRTDFLDQCMNVCPEFGATIKTDGTNPFSYITPMTDRELKLVIKNPAAKHGVGVEAELVAQIINDFRDIPGQSQHSLPLLQYTLDELWKNDDLSDRQLNQDTYKEIGGVGGALQRKAEIIYKKFEGQGKGELVEQIFLKLVTITADGKYVSNRRNKEIFKEGEIKEIVNELIDEHRLLVSGRQQNTIEIAHEALINSWSRLQDWLKNHEEAIVLDRQLNEAAKTWYKVRTDKEKAIPELWTGSKLERILELINEKAITGLEATVEQFIQASVAWRDRTLREKQEQIEKLDRALTEFKLRETAGRIINITSAQTQEVLLLAITAMGKILDKIPENLLASVQFSLNKVMTEVKVPVIIGKHQGSVNSLAFSPDGKFIVTGGGDGTLCLWNRENNSTQQLDISKNDSETHIYQGLIPNFWRCLFSQAHKSSIKCVAFSPDGKVIASGSDNGKVRLWDTEGNPIKTSSPGYKRSGNCLFFSGDVAIVGKKHKQAGKEHKKAVNCLVFSPDGKTIMSGGDDGTVRWWDKQGNCISFDDRGNPTGKLFDPNGSILSICCDPSIDPNHPFYIEMGIVVSRSRDGKLHFWDLFGNHTGTLVGHSGGLFRHEGVTYIGVTDEQLESFMGPGGFFKCVAFSPDGTRMVIGCSDKKLRLENTGMGELSERHQNALFSEEHQDAVFSVAFSPDGKTIASGSSDGIVRLWDLQGNLIQELFQGYKIVGSPSGKPIAIARDISEETLRLWRLEWRLHPLQKNLQVQKIIVFSLSFSPDSKTLVSGSSDGTVHLWDLENNCIGQPFQGHNDSVNSVAFSPDGQFIVSGDDRGEVRLWNLQGNPIGYPFSKHEDSVYSVAFSPNGKYIVSGSMDTTLRLWDIKVKSIGEPFRGHKGVVASVAFSPDGEMIVSGSSDGTVRLWDIQGNLIGQPLQGHNHNVNSVAFSPDGKMIVSGSADQTIRLWDIHGNPIGQPLQGHEQALRSVAFSPDGKMIVSGSADKIIRLWDIEGNYIRQLFASQENWVNSVAFSPDGKTIASGSEDGTVCLFDLEGNSIGQPLVGHESAVTSVAFSPDGKIIVSGSLDKTLRLWRGHWTEWLKVCCDRLKHHPAFTNPQTEDEKSACDIANRYVFNPHLGADELYCKAKQKLTTKDYTAAADIFTLAIQINPDHVQAYRYRGLAYYILKQYYRAIKDCDYILKIHPNDAAIIYTRGRCYSKLNKPEQAQFDYQQAIILYEQQGNLKQAEKIRKHL